MSSWLSSTNAIGNFVFFLILYIIIITIIIAILVYQILNLSKKLNQTSNAFKYNYTKSLFASDFLFYGAAILPACIIYLLKFYYILPFWQFTLLSIIFLIILLLLGSDSFISFLYQLFCFCNEIFEILEAYCSGVNKMKENTNNRNIFNKKNNNLSKSSVGLVNSSNIRLFQVAQKIQYQMLTLVGKNTP